jgi:DNA end-binding protein Ku
MKQAWPLKRAIPEVLAGSPSSQPSELRIVFVVCILPKRSVRPFLSGGIRMFANPFCLAAHSAAERAAATAAAPRGRASWSGLLRLSLVAIPVKAYPATSSAPELSFHQLHAGCGQRIRYDKRCPLHGSVDAGAIVRGYAYAPEQHMVLDDAELDRLRPAKDKALTLDRFLDPAQLDPVIFAGRSLYLWPDGPAARHPYAVLAQAMQQRRKWALARGVLSTRRVLALVRPAGRLLAIHVLHFPAQLRSATSWEADLQAGASTPAEEELAGQLIDASSQPVHWTEYQDDTAAHLARLVEARLQGQTAEVAAPEEIPVQSLLEALKQSVAQALPSEPAVATAAPGCRGRKKAPRRSA